MSLILESLRRAFAADNLERQKDNVKKLGVREIEMLVAGKQPREIYYDQYFTIDKDGNPREEGAHTVEQLAEALTEMGFVIVARSKEGSAPSISLQSTDKAFEVVLQEISNYHDKSKRIEARAYLQPDHVLMYVLTSLSALAANRANRDTKRVPQTPNWT